LNNIVQEARQSNLSDGIIKLLLKEFLQDIVLSHIYSHKNFKELIFYGGTCLRKLYGLDRFSEDLDFESFGKFDLELLGKYLQEEFKKDGIEVEYKIQRGENINRVTLKFPILLDLGLSSYNNENLHIKVEVNFDVKGECNTEKTPYTVDQYSCVIKHYSLEVLMAGKMIACVNRMFKRGENNVTKGRDFYDLIWYINQNIKPDISKLKDEGYTLESMLDNLDTKIGNIEIEDLKEDLFPYFTNTRYIDDWCNNFKEIYQSSKRRLIGKM
jgi:predicted nucleotidyltransferase component of viral defense system